MTNINSIIYIIRCSINNKPLDISMSGNIDYDKLYKFSKKQNIETIIYPAIKHADINNIKKWEHDFNLNIKTALLNNEERNKLFKFMDENNIWYVPLKGIVLQDYYPCLGMRSMFDNDILFDEKKSQLISDYMKNEGYKLCMSNTDDRHINFIKSPCFNFEMHKNLFVNDDKNNAMSNYFSDIENMLHGEGNKKYFSNEDFYIYQTCHHYKHDSVTGSGIRPLIDIYVYLKNNDVDLDYCNKVFKSMNIDDFEKRNRDFALKLFKDSKETIALSKEDEDLFNYIISGSLYGSSETMLEKKLDKISTENKNILLYMFPSFDHMKDSGMKNINHRILTPIYWIKYNRMRYKTYGFKTLIKSIKKRKHKN